MDKFLEWWTTISTMFKAMLGIIFVLFSIVVIGIILLIDNQQLEHGAMSSQLEQSDVLLLSHVEAEMTQMSSTDDQTVNDSTEKTVIYVDIKGAVNHPNVYALPEGSRLFDAIELAGGLRSDAATEQLNQAQLLTDQMMIYVYTVQEIEAQTNINTDNEGSNVSSPLHTIQPITQITKEDESQTHLVNVNTATSEELQTLPGIGPKKAEAIIQYRTENGSFASIEALMEVSGIGSKTFEQLSVLITAEN